MTLLATKEDPINSARHCVTEIPYRMIVYERSNQGTPLYCVAGSAKRARGAEKALKEAFDIHGGNCFYCKEEVEPGQLSIDHAEPSSAGGKRHLQNLLIAHKACNLAKGSRPIEAFHPEAGREWLSALLAQVQDRLNRLERATAFAPPRPEPDATAGP